MPEGHSILRYANRHHRLLAGKKVHASSPQGRFRGGAARIDGRKLLDVEAHGKHLFYHWDRAETLHIHLGLYGKFRTFKTEPPPPTPGTRLVLASEGTTIYLAGPTVCELIEPSREEAIRARLGPDPLQANRPGHTAARRNRPNHQPSQYRGPIHFAYILCAQSGMVGNTRAECRASTNPSR